MLITVLNPDRKESGCAELTVNGTALSEAMIPEELLTENTEIVVML